MADTTDQTAWYDVWGKIKAAIAQLDSAFTKLQAQAAYALSRPELAADYQSMMGGIESARSKALWLRDAVKSTLAAFGVNLSGLGFIPLVPIAVVVAGTAYVAKLAADAWSLSARIDEQRRLEASGMSPAAAAQLARQSNPASSGGLVSFNLGPSAGLIGAAVVIGGLWWWLRRGRG